MDISGIIERGKSPYDSHIIWLDQLCGELESGGKNFFIYGASLVTERLLTRFFDRQLLPCCLCDSDENKWATRMSSIKIVSPEEAVSSYPDAVCVIAVRAAGAHYENLSKRLENAGCERYYILSWDECPREKDSGLVEDTQKNKSALLACRAQMKDELSKERFDSFICAYLSSRVGETVSLVIGAYKPLDAHALQSDLITLSAEDVLISCRCGLDRRNAEFLEYAGSAKRAHLLEPCISSRTITAEAVGVSERTLIYPYIAASESGGRIKFDEKLCMSGYIDFLKYEESSAKGTAIDDLQIADATILYLDLSGKHAEALRGAADTISGGIRAIIMTGFRRTSEIPAIMESYPDWKYYFRHFGGQDMREGYALIAMP